MNHESMTPTQLAEEVFKIIHDSDHETADTALSIARLLLVHRQCSMIEFERQEGRA